MVTAVAIGGVPPDVAEAPVDGAALGDDESLPPQPLTVSAAATIAAAAQDRVVRWWRGKPRVLSGPERGVS
jgi:hypothetical protein